MPGREILLAAAFLFALPPAADAHAAKKVVLIGGAKSEGPARHDYANGIRVLKALLAASPDTRGLEVEAHPEGWPRDPAALDGAATLVWYFDGLDRHPLLDADRRARFEALMRRGVGLVALHQASTVPAGDTTMDLARWLGGARYGMFDRTDERAELAPRAHPITRGVGRFAHFDEFYPTFRFDKPVTPILTGTLRAQFRDGRDLVDAKPQVSTVAWTFERRGGGRSFAFSGGHYLAALDEPALRKVLLNAILWTARVEVPKAGVRTGLPDAATRLARAQTDVPTFHRDPQRTGWNSHENVLTPARVAGPSFGLLWESPQLDGIDGQPPRLYASPLFIDRVTLSSGEHKGGTFAVVFAATNTGFVYAINAFRSGRVEPGTILWRTRLGAPCRLQPAPLDGIPTGVLSTPVIDAARKRLYVTSCEPDQRWQAFALDLASGALLPGWPVRLDEATFNAVNRNAGPAPVAPTRRHDFRVQRGALNLSPDARMLYVTFGETETGWIVAVDTANAKVSSAFAAAAVPHRGSGGIWGAGGPAVDARGNVFVVTGSGFNGYVDRANDWTQSVLMLSEGLELRGTYTPFNHCETAANDIDLGSGGASLVPDADLLVVGGKQGNVYLLDRARLPGRLDRRPPCSTDSASDRSLLAPHAQPQFGKRGPLNVFGPYSEKDAAMDLARARSVPSHFRQGDGKRFVFVTGNTRKSEGSPVGVAPSLARLEVVASAGESAYLRIDRVENTLAFGNPGSPFVTSNGPREAIVWVLDENAPRSALLSGAHAPRPVLHAFDAMTLEPLWKSAPGELFTSGKYNEPAFARGRVFVGTDRIQAFGLGGRRAVPGRTADAVAAPTPRPIASSGLSGETLYAQRCAACHDHPQGNIPSRERIAKRSHEYIVEVLGRGAMRPYAEGLSDADIDAVARYLQ
jgi:type 1 glutamine amidotransferase/cytochrome c5